MFSFHFCFCFSPSFSSSSSVAVVLSPICYLSDTHRTTTKALMSRTFHFCLYLYCPLFRWHSCLRTALASFSLPFQREVVYSICFYVPALFPHTQYMPNRSPVPYFRSLIPVCSGTSVFLFLPVFQVFFTVPCFLNLWACSLFYYKSFVFLCQLQHFS